MTEHPPSRLSRHRLASEQPQADLEWWLWDLACDPIGEELCGRVGSLGVDSIDALLLRRRLLSVSAKSPLEAVALRVDELFHRSITRQAVHSRVAKVEESINQIAGLADEAAITQYLDERLGRAAHLEDLAPWEIAVLTACAPDDAPWATPQDCAQLVASRVALNRCVDGGWWFDAPPGTDVGRWARQLADELLDLSGAPVVASERVSDALAELGVIADSRQRCLDELERQGLTLRGPEGQLVLFPASTTRTLSDRLRHLVAVLDLSLEEAADLLALRHGENRRTLANVIRSLRSQGN
jgi:hypothetical protein